MTDNGAIQMPDIVRLLYVCCTFVSGWGADFTISNFRKSSDFSKTKVIAIWRLKPSYLVNISGFIPIFGHKNALSRHLPEQYDKQIHFSVYVCPKSISNLN